MDGVSWTGNFLNHVSYNSAFFGFTRHTAVSGNTFLNDVPVVSHVQVAAALALHNLCHRTARHRCYRQGLFNLGTTDIIVGPSDATLSITDNEIANRGACKVGRHTELTGPHLRRSPRRLFRGCAGEFVGGPDGCGIDLEDSSTGIVLARNTITRTYGAGIMLFAGTGPGRCSGCV